MFSQHGIENDIRKYISGTICVCCMKDSHTRKKIVHHVSFRSPRCKKYWLSCEPISSEEYCKLETESTTSVRHPMHIGRSPLYSDPRPCRVTGPIQHCAALKIGHRAYGTPHYLSSMSIPRLVSVGCWVPGYRVMPINSFWLFCSLVPGVSMARMHHVTNGPQHPCYSGVVREFQKVAGKHGAYINLFGHRLLAE